MLIERAITAGRLGCSTRGWLPSALFPSEEPLAYDPGPASSRACLACKQAKRKVTPLVVRERPHSNSFNVETFYFLPKDEFLAKTRDWVRL